MKVEDVITMISNKTGIKTEDLKKELEGILETFKKELPDLTQEAAENMSANKMSALYRKQMISTGETFNGIIVSIGRRFDMVEKKRKVQQKVVDANFEQAVKDKLCNEDGVLLYWEPAEKVAKMADWQKKNLGTKIPMTDFRRTLSAITMVEGKLISSEIRLRGKNSEVVPKLFTKMSYTGFKLRTSTEDFYRINDSGSFIPKYEGVLTETEVNSLFLSMFKDKIITLDKISEFVDAHQGQYSPESLAIMKVNVIDISTTETSTGSTIVSVADNTIPMDEIITCWVPDYIKVTFPEASEIYVIGSPKIDDEKKSISVEGIFVPSIYKLPETKSVEKW